MSIISKAFGLFPKVLGYKLARHKLIKSPKPLTLTFSVTNKCNSRCKTCFIWRESKKIKQKELNLDEIEKIFKSIGKVFFFNISGGEPFLRKDLTEICELACRHLKPSVIHTPTNAIATDLVVNSTRKILKMMKEKNYCIPFTIKPSFDGIGKKHDKIRGIKDNFKKVMKTIEELKKLQKQYPNLDIGLGTVISRYNLKDIPEIVKYVKKLNVDSYINEIAEERSELFNFGSKVTPSAEEYRKSARYFKNLKLKKNLSKFTQAFRLVYYDIVYRILKNKKQVIPCYAGLTNAHITPYGGVWPCCILGYSKELGNLRNHNYSFNKIWNSRKAEEIRKFIYDKKCYCPLANQAYSNILCDFKSIIKVLKRLF